MADISSIEAEFEGLVAEIKKQETIELLARQEAQHLRRKARGIEGNYPEIAKARGVTFIAPAKTEAPPASAKPVTAVMANAIAEVPKAAPKK